MSRALCLLLLFPVFTAVAQDKPHPSAAAAAKMHAAVGQVLTTLNEQQKSRILRPFDDAERLDWHYTPRSRGGLSFKEMDKASRDAVHALLRTALSAAGYRKATNIIELEIVLREIETFGWSRDPERYHLTVYGTPDRKQRWGWRFEGHHLSLNFTLAGERLAGDRGRRKGLRSGRFLLLGSASIDLLRQSGESLAGRVAHLELDRSGRPCGRRRFATRDLDTAQGYRSIAAGERQVSMPRLRAGRVVRIADLLGVGDLLQRLDVLGVTKLLQVDHGGVTLPRAGRAPETSTSRCAPTPVHVSVSVGGVSRGRRGSCRPAWPGTWPGRPPARGRRRRRWW